VEDYTLFDCKGCSPAHGRSNLNGVSLITEVIEGDSLTAWVDGATLNLGTAFVGAAVTVWATEIIGKRSTHREDWSIAKHERIGETIVRGFASFHGFSETPESVERNVVQ
jgi:hypothetical protein